MEVKHNVGPSLMWAIPTLGRPVPLEWALNFKSINPPINFNVDYNIVLGKEIGYARNALAKAALDRGCKYLFFLGDDVVAPPHTLRQLIYRMENQPDVDVVGGVYCAKADPPAPLVFVKNGEGSYWDWKVGEFFECSGLGMDCTLIRTSLLEKIPEPWFKTVDIDQHIDGKAKVEAWTEDLYFLNKVSQVGGRIFCDASIICDHWDVYTRKAYKLPKDSLPMRQRGVVKDKRCLMLGPEVPIADQSFDIIRCTQDGDHSADYRVQYGNLPFDAAQFDFVCVTDYVLDVQPVLDEWKRVAKPGAKIAFNIDPRLSPEHLVKSLGGTIDGSFLELVNGDGSN
jgi:SAM-dependent methyltransferase